MTDKAVISEYTYRTLKGQRESLEGMPVFVLPDDLPSLFRATTRKTENNLYVESLGVLADTEEKFREFLALAKKRNATIISIDDEQTFVVNGNCENLVKWWKDARRKGSAVEGGRLGAAVLKADVAARLKDFTKEEWTDGSIKNSQLVEKYHVSLGAMRRYASDKGWGWNRQQAIWRAEQKKGKANAKR